MKTDQLTASTAPAPLLPRAPSSFPAGPAWGALVLLALGAAALFLSRRRRFGARRMEVVESLSLGPRRSLCLARVDGRTLVLGVSEAGVQLLTTHETPAPKLEDDGFEQLLKGSVAEQELRAQLAARSPPS